MGRFPRAGREASKGPFVKHPGPLANRARKRSPVSWLRAQAALTIGETQGYYSPDIQALCPCHEKRLISKTRAASWSSFHLRAFPNPPGKYAFPLPSSIFSSPAIHAALTRPPMAGGPRPQGGPGTVGEAKGKKGPLWRFPAVAHTSIKVASPCPG